MTRKLVLFLAVLTIAALSDPPSAQAVRISRQNPYRSFNISGINYGSMQWERQHRRQATQNRQTRRRGWFGQGLFRRRR
jgi:hypothetical protein